MEEEANREISKDMGGNDDEESSLSQDHFPSRRAGWDKTLSVLEIAEKLHTLEGELEVNLSEQFEIFLRTCSKRDSEMSVKGKTVLEETVKIGTLSEQGMEADSFEFKESIGGEKSEHHLMLDSAQGDEDTAICVQDVTEERGTGVETKDSLDEGEGNDGINSRKRLALPEEETEDTQENKVRKCEDTPPEVCHISVWEPPISRVESPISNGEPTSENEDKTLVVTIVERNEIGVAIVERNEMGGDGRIGVGPEELSTVAREKSSEKEVEEELELVDVDRVEPLPISFSEFPLLLTSAKDDFVPFKGNNFLKGCKWSPDGTCILTNSEDGTLRLFNLPGELYDPGSWTPIPDLKAVLKMVEGELIYDYCWYPEMSSLQPETCCFVSCSRGHPVHMWDAFDGRMRCSYRPHNHMDDLITPHSLCFSLDGRKLYCGFNKLIKVFDTTRPGKDCQSRQTKVSGKLGGQTGIISCFAMTPDGRMFAAGSYSKTIGLYTDNCPSPVSLLTGQASGVTHLMYSLDSNRIYSGSRKDNNILCWDIRKSTEALFRMERNVTTNQRMYFDIDREDRYLLSGNQDGKVTVWDLSLDWTSSEHSSLPPLLDHVVQFVVHQDTTNGISLHPSLPLLATASGQREKCQPLTGSDGESDEEDVEEGREKTFHNSLRIWSLYENR